MSIKIESAFNLEENMWNVALIGELDVSSAEVFKKSLNDLVDENSQDIKIDLDRLRVYRFNWSRSNGRRAKKIESQW